MANVLSIEDADSRIVHHLVKDLRSGPRSRCHRDSTSDTICRLLVKFGTAAGSLLDQQMRRLELRHLECRRNLDVRGQEARQAGRRQETMSSAIRATCTCGFAFDEDTKLIPTFMLGKRTADIARRFMVDLASRMQSADADRHGVRAGIIPQISDGRIRRLSRGGRPGVRRQLPLRPDLIKDYRNADHARSLRGPRNGRCRTARDMRRHRRLHDLHVSHVERNNLTIRTFMKRFTRLSLGFSKKLENLAAATVPARRVLQFLLGNAGEQGTGDAPGTGGCGGNHPGGLVGRGSGQRGLVRRI